MTPPPRQTTPVGNDFLELRAELGTALYALTDLASKVAAPAPLVSVLQNLQTSLREPFLFVVVGEVKAGKSSLLNAVFGREFCRVDVLPATDRVYMFKYGEPARDVDVSPSLTERYQPVSFLRDFNIVDTPGTNTIVADHQTITEQFAPQADLIVFVFSVVNPWAASAWEFLGLLQKKWLKNVVFVLQQADLRDEREVEAIAQHLRQTALQKLGQSFPIFPVSAKKALLSKSGGVDKDRLWQESRFEPFERYVNQTIGNNETRTEKLRSVCKTAQVVRKDLAETIRGASELIRRDRAQLDELRQITAQLKQNSLRQAGVWVASLDRIFTRIERGGEELLAERLKFWETLKLVWNRDHKWQQDFQDEINRKFDQETAPELEHILDMIGDDLKFATEQVQHTVQQKFPPETRAQAAAGGAAAAPDFTERRKQLVSQINLSVTEQTTNDQIRRQLQADFGETASWVRLPLSGTIVAAGSVAALFAHVAAAAVFDVTGILGVLTMISGGALAYWKRNRILRNYRDQMARRRAELDRAFGDHFRQSLESFYQKLGQLSQPLEDFCNRQEERYRPQLEQVQKQEEQFNRLANRLAIR